ncbi:MAG: acyltransferase [Bacteroidetes bacterium]|nr:acyltransferase [Bacteroidota bacterium]
MISLVSRKEKNKANYYPQLDGLRGIAILLVVAYHYFGFIGLFSFGWSGVDLFFVLSGFLITGKLMDSVNEKNYFRHFYRNRILRIFPLYYAVLIIYYLNLLFFVQPEHLPNTIYYKEHWESFFFFFQNWSFLIYGFPKDQHLIHFWSLAVEEQFYLAWPIMIYLLSKKPKWLIVLLISLSLSSLLLRCFIFWGTFSEAYKHVDMNTFCRMDSFAAGAIASVALYSGTKTNKLMLNFLIIFSSMALGIFIYSFNSARFSNNPFLITFGFSLTAILYAGILYKLIAEPKSFFSKILLAKWLKFFGKISYGLYIFHWMITVIFSHAIFDWCTIHLTGNNLTGELIAALGCISISVALSALSFYYFESYFLRLKKKNNV